jgi:hypothetical protein
MGSIAIDTKKSRTNVKNIFRKISRFSLDADAFHESQDWPYLWPKDNEARSTYRVATPEEIAARKVRNRRLLKIAGWGLISLVMYLGVFLNQGTITDHFSQGGFFAFAVVGTAIAFALIHGTFASHVLESMNFRAANRGKDDH